MLACWTSFSSLEDEETTPPKYTHSSPPGQPPISTRCQKLSTLYLILLLSGFPESIFISMEKVSKNSTTKNKPKRTLFERAGLKPVTPPSREEAVLAEIVHRYGDCRDQMNKLQFAILCELVDARLYREARGV